MSQGFTSQLPIPLPVAQGGTGLTSTTAYAVVCGGTTSTGNLQSIAGVGTSGQVLTSNGAGALPTFQNASSVSAATQAEQEAGSSTTVYTSPGRQQYHPSACKYWMNLHGTDTFAINQSYNISSATDGGVGTYSYNITVAFSAATECIVVNAFSASGDRNNTTVGTTSWGTGTGALSLRNQAGTLVDMDNTCVAGFGDQ
jgi:hypothetical protein